MLSYMLPTEDKPPPPGEPSPRYHKLPSPSSDTAPSVHQPHHHHHHQNRGALNLTTNSAPSSSTHSRSNHRLNNGYTPIESILITTPTAKKSSVSPKHNGFVSQPILLTSKTAKDEQSQSSVDSDPSSQPGSERKSRHTNGPKQGNLKRVSFGSSKGSMVETLVFETPVQEEPEPNHFLEHNGLPAPMIPVPDMDEGREKVRVTLGRKAPFPSTPGVLLLEPLPIDAMAASPAELLTAHTDHIIPTYHTQISTDSGWDNPFRPDGDLSREADQIVELIKGGKPITPTLSQNGPALPGCERKTANDLEAPKNSTKENGNAHSTPVKSVNEKNPATVDVSRVTAMGPGDASQVEHVTLKKNPKCECCVIQ